ncbi:bleomycin hydrolase isoform X1 [Schistocerca americana]|uniref:bleomycin hydrolase isoform X1 n=1 Tax=Schistocerca americana TaxID=7009 RepID=UPI001F4FB465|nr:bleomycin hydrolase isoform X1 [Schistocerca americana]XP_047097426.1 bleomycin hydrolase isoform X1 [Schistocerca piceifrons]XP_049942254.1 bleomycin hydrolase isoform X1 [Schistocerca serialis cubense]
MLKCSRFCSFNLTRKFHASVIVTCSSTVKMSSTGDLARNAALTPEILQRFRTNFYSEPKNCLAQNACTRTDPLDVCMSRKQLEETQHVFTHKVEIEGKPVTNQKTSGRCWLFAALNVMRVPFMKHYNLDEFEFSQAYLFFWDKIERCNFFLYNMVETARRGEEVTGRLVHFLLSDPATDGGQWDMFCSLVNKHGLMPKKCFPESYSCESSSRMNNILKSKLREYTKVLRDLISKGANDTAINECIENQMEEVYRIVGICLGIPSETFTWEYYDKSKNYSSIGPITPLDFYIKHVKPHFNVDDKVCLVTDPRSTSPYGKAYTVDFLGNMVGGRRIIYNNQPVELLMKLCADSIRAGDPVWFGCEIAKRFASKLGIGDLDIHDYKLVFGVDVTVGLSKADRLVYGEGVMNHAMAFTAVSVGEDGKPTKFRVENSWGDDRGEKGYLLMTAEWFKEFVLEIVVDRKLVSREVLEVFEQEPVVLPAWDPMGTLAH